MVGSRPRSPVKSRKLLRAFSFALVDVRRPALTQVKRLTDRFVVLPPSNGGAAHCFRRSSLSHRSRPGHHVLSLLFPNLTLLHGDNAI